MTSLFDEYLTIYNKYSALYGNRVAVLMQCGDFYEFYGLQHEQLGNIGQMADLLNLNIGRKRKEAAASRTNYEVAGFPLSSLDKYRGRLLELGCQVVVVEQAPGTASSGGRNLLRVVTEIVSQTTDLNSVEVNNYLAVVVIAEDGSGIGIAGGDLTTGQLWVDEFSPKPGDSNWARDELTRMLQSYNPREVLVMIEGGADNPLADLELSGYNTLWLGYSAEDHRVSNQERILSGVPGWTSNMGIGTIENLELGMFPLSIMALVEFVKYIQTHNPNLLLGLSLPNMPTKGVGRLILAQNAITQLNLIAGSEVNRNMLAFDKSQFNKKIGCVLDVISRYVKTNMGQRLAHFSLTNPSCLLEWISQQQSWSQWMMSTDGGSIARLVAKHLDGIRDLTKLRRKLESLRISPNDACVMWDQFSKLRDLIVEMPGLVFPVGLEVPTQLSSLVEWNFLDPVGCRNWKKGNNDTIGINLFKAGVDSELDMYTNKMAEINQWFASCCGLLNGEFGAESFKPNIEESCIYCSVAKWKRVQESIKNSGSSTQTSIGQTISQLVVKEHTGKSIVKVTNNQITEASQHWIQAANLLDSRCETIWELWKKQCNLIWGKFILQVENWVANLDVSQAKCKLCLEFGYCWPQLGEARVDGSGSWVQVEGLRHAIIERIDLKQTYVPHNLSLGCEDGQGIMLYGLNGTGKSSVMKALGIAIVLAQAGWPVPATSMRLAPFKQILTRILGQDNLFRGRSTFETEISELRGILERHHQDTLVLGDELCHGTESDSQMALIVSTVVRLASKSTKFIIATHNHPVANHPKILELPQVRIWHLSSHRLDGRIVYDREMKPGSGEPLYGIEVAEALGVPADVVKLAYSIRQVPTKVSRYNSAVLLGTCEKCGAPATETHHIVHQARGETGGLYMHQQSNLACLCDKCHQQIHRDEVELVRKSLVGGGSLLMSLPKLAETP